MTTQVCTRSLTAPDKPRCGACQAVLDLEGKSAGATATLTLLAREEGADIAHYVGVVDFRNGDMQMAVTDGFHELAGFESRLGAIRSPILRGDCRRTLRYAMIRATDF